MDESARRKWQARYSSADYEPHTEAEPLLREGAAQWKKGEALCLAAGAGRNAVFLAECGFAVTAVDISEHGLERCRQLANERGVEGRHRGSRPSRLGYGCGALRSNHRFLLLRTLVLCPG
ncbi:MAG: class I SAM-dependent methyltransferase [Candidatus Latescibacterota bacterium]